MRGFLETAFVFLYGFSICYFLIIADRVNLPDFLAFAAAIFSLVVTVVAIVAALYIPIHASRPDRGNNHTAP